MARPQGYLDDIDDLKVLHLKIPRRVAEWFYRTYGYDAENTCKRSNALAMTVALEELKSLKSQQ